MSKIDFSNCEDFDSLFSRLGIKNKDVQDFVKTTDAANISLTSFQTHANNANNSISKFSSAMKTLGGIGKTALAGIANIGVSMLASWVIEKGIGAISDYIHRNEILVEEGKEAKSSISDTFDEFSKGKQALTDLGKSFATSEDQIKTINQKSPDSEDF